MFLLVGLGNPGEKYFETRHNCGFVLAELAVKKHKGSPWQRRGELFLFSSIDMYGKTVKVIKPTTFMNRSGLAVAQAIRDWDIGPERLVVAHDDLDLEAGRLRIRTGGGNGGHNGIRSIMEETGTGEFARIKLGIGRPPRRVSTIDHVLGNFANSEWLELHVMVERGVAAIETLVAEGVEQSMNRFNKK